MGVRTRGARVPLAPCVEGRMFGAFPHLPYSISSLPSLGPVAVM